MLLVISFAFALNACSNTVPNAEVCADMGHLGSFCAFTIRGPERRLSKRQWDQYRYGQLCMNVENFAKYQKFIERACQQNKNCVEEAEVKFTEFENRMARGTGSN